MLELRTVNDILSMVAGRGDKTAAMYQSGGEWKTISGKQMVGRVRAAAEMLMKWGIQPGDRVALVCENRWEWPVADFAILGIGAVNVPLYQTLTPEQMGYILRDSGAKAVLVSSKQQYAKLVGAGELPAVGHVAVFDDGDFDNAERLSEVMKRAPELESLEGEFAAKMQAVKPEDMASIVYTSGTTGDPKGVVLTHQNIAQNLKHSTDGLYITDKDSSISFLPLSHALARHLDYALYGNGAVVAYLPKFDNLLGAAKAIKPTIFLAVPRVFEKVRQGIESKSTGFKRTVLNWAQGVAKGKRDDIMAGRQPGGLGWSLANKLVFSKMNEALGGQVRLFVSGGAPLGTESTEWFLNMGVRIFEGYGLTETSPVISRNTFDGYKPGTVGTIVPNMETRVAGDGELEVKGPNVFAGYWKKDEETKKEFTEDGWFKTGDVGKIEDGYLTITDRKKELIKTSGGKYIAPQPIEGKLKGDGLVGSAAVIGDTRKFASVLISPEFPALEKWAAQNGVSTKDHAELVKDPKVQKQYEAIVKKVNATLEHHETLKKVGLVADEWTVDTGELTPSMKLKRRIILDKYKEQIDALYAGGGGGE